MALDIAVLRRVLHHQFSRYFSNLPFPAKCTSMSKHGARLHWEFKYSATFVATKPIRRSFCERDRVRRNKDEARKEKTMMRRRKDSRLNGTELKSFAWRQARHVAAAVAAGSWAWQSSRQRHACLPFLVRPYNWNSRKKKGCNAGSATGRSVVREKEKTRESDSTTNGALVKRRFELQRSLHLSPWVCGPPRIPAGGSSPSWT